MLFHITAKHDHETCPGKDSGPNGPAAVEFQRWMEGNDDVKVLGVYGYNVSHKIFGIVESEDMQAVTNLLRPQMFAGDVEVLPVMDSIAVRKSSGNWGK